MLLFSTLPRQMSSTNTLTLSNLFEYYSTERAEKLLNDITELLGVTYTITYGNRLDLRLRWFVDGVVLSRKARMNKVWRRRKGIVDKVKW